MPVLFRAMWCSPICSLATALTGCPMPTTVSIAPMSATLEVGATVTLTASSTSAADDVFVWTSDDPTIATVNQDGVVTGVAGGTTIVRVTARPSGVGGSATVTVTGGGAPGEGEGESPMEGEPEGETMSEVEMTFAPNRDASIYEAAKSPAPANGMGDSLIAGAAGARAGGAVRRALLRFDLSAIPTGATIASVELTLNVIRSAPGSAATDFDLHMVTTDWTEGPADPPNGGPNNDQGVGTDAAAGDVTWFRASFDTADSAMPGGDTDTLLSATASVGGGGEVTWTGGMLAADVQAWVAGDAPNRGWLLKVANESPQSTARQFASRENSDAGLRPTLTVQYVN